MGTQPRDELVRIDRTGQAHPIGARAGAMLRQRTGAYRLLPAPQHVVFMRFTGEDGRRDEGDGRVVRLAGEITAPGALCEPFAMMGQTAWRGEAVIMVGSEERSVYFENGNVVGAHSNVPEERLGSLMFRYGAITAEQHEALCRQEVPERRFGAQAASTGAVSQERVYEFLRRQVEEIVFASLLVADGTFFFLDGFDDHVLPTRHALSANALLMDAVTRMDEMRYFRDKIPSAQHVPALRVPAPPPPPELVDILALVDGHRSVDALGRDTGRGEHAVTKDLFTLIRSGHVVMLPPAVDGGLEALVVLANGALRDVHSRVDGSGDGIAFRETLARYVVGAGVHDLMFRGAGPAGDGTFAVARVVSNVETLAQGDAEHYLRQQLHDYLSFATFSASAQLGAEEEAALSVRSSRISSLLQPPG